MEILEDFPEPLPHMPPDVLKDNEAGVNFSNDSPNLRPQVPGVLSPLLLPCLTERLARVSGSDEIHLSTPLSASEGLEIVPDRSLIQPLLFHPCHEDGRRKGFPLDVANGPGSKGSMDAEVKSSDP